MRILVFNYFLISEVSLMTIFSCRRIQIGFPLAWAVFALGFIFLLGAALLPQGYFPALSWYAGLGLVALSSVALSIGALFTLLLPEPCTAWAKQAIDALTIGSASIVVSGQKNRTYLDFIKVA
jgi:hypothetical protein